MKSFITLLILTAALQLAGCNSYVLKGKVVKGEKSSIELVHEMDPRIRAFEPGGLANVEVRVYRDPDNMNKKLSGRERTPVDGTFSLNLGDFGAGWMTEEWLVQAYSYGFQTAQQQMKLPAKNAKTRLLITLAPGESIEPSDQADYVEDYEKYK